MITKRKILKEIDTLYEELGMSLKLARLLNWSVLDKIRFFRDRIADLKEHLSDEIQEHRELQRLIPPEADEEIPANSDVYTMKEFEERCHIRAFINSDGYGYYSIRGKMNSNLKISPLDVIKKRHHTGYSHVIWFNR